MQAFNKHMKEANQISKEREEVKITEEDLLTVPKGQVTFAGLQENIRVSILYLEAWLRGLGCVAISNKMEDLATAEISRSQVSQWIKHKISTKCGKKVTLDLVQNLLEEQCKQISTQNPKNTPFVNKATELLSLVFSCSDVSFIPFLPSVAYSYILTPSREISKL